MSEPRSDEALMQAYYNGDDDAFGILYERCFLTLAAHARKALPAGFPGKEQEAEDCAADGLLKAMMTKHRPSSRWDPQQGKVATWLKTIVFNQAMDRLRRKSAKPATDLGSDDQNALEHLAVDHRDVSAMEAAETEQELQAMWEQVDELPAELRQIVNLKHRQGLKHQEIAERLGSSRSTITRRLQQAKRLIAGKL